MLNVQLLPAGQGDAIIVEWGRDGNTYRMLVDAGPKPHWPEVREGVIAGLNRKFSLWVVTHVDEDHIGGAIELLQDPVARPRVGNIWFNGYRQCASGGDILGPVHGELFTQLIVQGNYPWNAHFQPEPAQPTPVSPGLAAAQGDRAALRRIPLDGGATIVLLAPNGPKLTKLANTWQKVVEAAGIVPGAGTVGVGPAAIPGPKEVPPLPHDLSPSTLQKLAEYPKTDSSQANGSSIAVVFEYGGKRVLLTGDAHPQPLTRNLLRYGALVKEKRPRFDLVKLPHHGSGANVTPALVAAIDADRYLISSDGMGYGHPDDSAIARVILGSRGPVTFFCNYDSYRSRPWAEQANKVNAAFVLPEPDKPGITVAA
jgi:hypothetical protein